MEINDNDITRWVPMVGIKGVISPHLYMVTGHDGAHRAGVLRGSSWSVYQRPNVNRTLCCQEHARDEF